MTILHRVHLPVAILLFLAGSASAFPLPKHVYSLAELDKAKAAALESGKGLTFVWTDPKYKTS